MLITQAQATEVLYCAGDLVLHSDVGSQEDRSGLCMLIRQIERGETDGLNYGDAYRFAEQFRGTNLEHVAVATAKVLSPLFKGEQFLEAIESALSRSRAYPVEVGHVRTRLKDVLMPKKADV